jgi:hypothetical protein
MAPPCDILTESGALRLLDWPESRRLELRDLASSHSCGKARIYQRLDIEKLRNPLNLIVRSAIKGAFAPALTNRALAPQVRPLPLETR